jgi:hypothetical protein
MPGQAAYKGREIRWFAQKTAEGWRGGFEVEMGNLSVAEPKIRHVDRLVGTMAEAEALAKLAAQQWIDKNG